LNEEKLCQLLANQARARRKRLRQAASHAHHLQIRQLQKLASLRVLAMAVQVQTLSHVKTAVVVVQNSVLQTPIPHALHAPRVRSSKSVRQKLMAQLATAGLQVMSVANLAKTAADTRVVQSALHMVATIAHLAQVTVTHVLHTVTAMTVVLVEETAQLTAVQVQLPVAATVAK
jgi:hypothetical protein